MMSCQECNKVKYYRINVIYRDGTISIEKNPVYKMEIGCSYITQNDLDVDWMYDKTSRDEDYPCFIRKIRQISRQKEEK